MTTDTLETPTDTIPEYRIAALDGDELVWLARFLAATPVQGGDTIMCGRVLSKLNVLAAEIVEDTVAAAVGSAPEDLTDEELDVLAQRLGVGRHVVEQAYANQRAASGA